MKTFLTFITFLICSQYAFANTVEIVDGDMGLNQATAKILKVEPMCPRSPGRSSCMAIGSRVTIEVSLNGCLDRMGGYFSNFTVVNGVGQLAFGAVNIQNEESLRVFCYQIPKEKVTILVPFEGKIEFSNMPLN